MTRAFNIKDVVHFSGFLLGMLGLFFVAYRLFKYSSDLDFSRVNVHELFILCLLVVVYAASNVLLACGWRQLLQHTGVAVADCWAIWAYGVSQLAKYVPGNIFHLVGRQALGVRAGHRNRPLVVASVWELCLIAFATLPFFLLTVLSLYCFFSDFQAVLVAFIFLCIALLGIYRFVGLCIAKSYLYYFLFLFTSGMCFWLTYYQVIQKGTLTFDTFVFFIAAYVVAWFAGLATPGAPAGLGVREAVLLFLLADVSDESALLMAILIARIITVLGDVLFYFFTVFFLREMGKVRVQSQV